jgi:hypothetical protein
VCTRVAEQEEGLHVQLHQAGLSHSHRPIQSKSSIMLSITRSHISTLNKPVFSTHTTYQYFLSRANDQQRLMRCLTYSPSSQLRPRPQDSCLMQKPLHILPTGSGRPCTISPSSESSTYPRSPPRQTGTHGAVTSSFGVRYSSTLDPARRLLLPHHGLDHPRSRLCFRLTHHSFRTADLGARGLLAHARSFCGLSSRAIVGLAETYAKCVAGYWT